MVDSPDTELFEQAIFIVRNDAMNRNGVTAQRLVDEACRVARTCGRTATCSKRSFFRRGPPPPAGGLADREALSGYHATTHHQLKYCIRFWFTIT